MFEKVAVIGDSDLVFAFRALGIKVFSPENLEETREIMETLEQENFALCFLHESFFEPLKEEIQISRQKFCPVVVGFSDYREVQDRIGQMMRDMAVRATGSDSLVKKRGKDEAR
jgi:vacuolar-type H+-ATPase subunit F/Vma7